MKKMTNNFIQAAKESKDVSLYTRLLNVFAEYCKNVPATGIDRFFDMAVAAGKSILPSDKRALDIIEYVLKESQSAPAVIQKLMNIRFSDLPIGYRPLIKNVKKHEVAFWQKNDELSDKVFSLLNFDGYEKGKHGRWATADGKKATIIK
jgi:hypothetical protein